ncbi:MAG: response regulator, partial [Vitreoscilla sp.]
QTNQELQDKARLLAHQNQEVERKNTEVEQARQALEEKAEQLALTSKYKSEFLANMSHELRTPLNSLLILSDQLCKNPDGNLAPKQVEFSKTIHSSGNDLLMLINDILDLSKIESGTVAVDASELRVDDLHRSVERGFRHFAESKHVDFAVELKHPLPKTMITDVKRLQQIIKNLLSNAFKFTHEGQVTFSISTATSGWSVDNDELHRAGTVLAFSVRDTGIGISPDKQQIIFEAFQQADGSTSRKYGGTGLGLAISRELSKLLGGEIRLISSPGKGSEFTLYLPQSYNPARSGRHARANANVSAAPTVANAATKTEARAPAGPPVAAPQGLDDWRYEEHEKPATDAVAFANAADDDRGSIATGDRVLLIVENDLAFARILLAGGRAAGFKGLVTSTGASALTLAREFHPSVITLDIHLPDMPGWRILDRLKADLVTRHIPICVVSTDDARDRALQSGALGFLAKPLQSADEADAVLAQLHAYAERSTKRLAVVMPPSARRSAFVATLDTDVDIVLAEDRESARHALAGADAVVVEDTLADFGPEDVLDTIAERPGICQLPVVLFHGGAAETGNWNQRRAGLTIVEAGSLPELRMQTALWLHRSPSSLSESDRDLIEGLMAQGNTLKGRKALIVDDDMRNIFALATVLDEEGIVIVSADNGHEAIRLVKEDPTIDIVLMDIMMPVMDGIETMQEIRKLPRGRELPMIAVTAKAMKGDRQKCIEAGAWDYISKPVDPRHLMSVLRGWLCR